MRTSSPASTLRHTACRLCLLATLLLWLPLQAYGAKPRTVYATFILHGNMNYDRYVRPTIWRDFPRIYDGLLTFLDEHPDFKGQLQFSGQTLGSLLQAAPDVVEHALTIHRRGQLNFTGTFYSEPVNVNMDGETNYLCALLGTKIVERTVGSTDGFYLQERAYHPQLPWILKNAGVSWTPIIVGDDTPRPFRLRGMDGTVSVGVPVTGHDVIVEKAKKMPAGSLLTIEEDYEIPQSFTKAYHDVDRFNQSQNDIRIEWITVKDYIRRFGLDAERFIDHSAKARNRDNGTYSRWTADPLDIRLQDETNQAMNDLRSAKIITALLEACYGCRTDLPLSESPIELFRDPLAWNIERAELYPDIESQFLKRGGKVTELSRAENLLLWAVNSDAKGWFPLYEKRRERAASFQNSRRLSRGVIYRALDSIAARTGLQGYDRYFIALNTGNERSKTVEIESDAALQLFDAATGQPLPTICHDEGGRRHMEARVDLPAYGYTLIGARRGTRPTPTWHAGNRIAQGGLSISADDKGEISFTSPEGNVSLRLDTFRIKALTEQSGGRGDDVWRSAKPYGSVRTEVSTDGLYPQLRVEWQPDWLVHAQALFTLRGGRAECELTFVFPHPTLVRKEGAHKGRTFNPEGLDLILNTGERSKVGYDIPFGISEYENDGISYFCALTSCFLRYEKGGGLMVTARTGEQAFAVDADKGQMTVYLGASTTSGPIRDVGMTFHSPTDVEHEEAWYAEPFHGTYRHNLVLCPYAGSWKEAHLPRTMHDETRGIYVKECFPTGRDAVQNATLPLRASLIETNAPELDITTMQVENGKLTFRINELEGRTEDALFTIGNKKYRIKATPFGIQTVGQEK